MNDQYASILRQQLPLFPGIEYVKEVFEDSLDGRQCAYILRIRRGADVRVDTVMSPDGQFRLQESSVSAKACRKPNETLIGVVNADFFNMTNGTPQGPVVMSGSVIKEDMPDNTYFFGIRQDGVPVIGDKTTFLENKPALKMAVGGRHLLVDGDDFPEAVLEPKYGCHPRTAVGICENGDLLLVVLDGRAPGVSEGLQLPHLARYLKSLGAEMALNLDGGGSTAMSLRMLGQREIELVNTPSDGLERVCANGIAVYAQRQGDGVCHGAYVTPQQEYVAPGTRLTMSAYGLDDLLGPCDLPGDICFSVPAESGCTVTKDGIFRAAQADCDVRVSVSAGERLLGTALLHVRTPDALHAPAFRICTEGEAHDLGVAATLKGCSMLTNCTSYDFRPLGQIGRFDENGLFLAGKEACEGDVQVCAKNNGPKTVLHVRVGRLPQTIEVSPDAIGTKGCTVGRYQPLHFSARRGQQVYRIDKQLPQAELQFDVPVPKRPKAVGMWVHSMQGGLPEFTLTVQNGKAAFVGGEPSDAVWTYMEAPVPGETLPAQTLKFAVSMNGAAETQLAVDSFRLIYDYVDDDMQIPEIRRIVIKKQPQAKDDGYVKITAYFGVGDLLPCYAPLDYKRLRILVDDREYTGQPGHYGVNKGAASLMLHNIFVGGGQHRVSVCAQTLGGKQAWKDFVFDTDQLE